VFNRQWWASAAVGVSLFALLLVGIILPVWGDGGTNPNQPPTDLVATTEDLGVALVDGNQYVLPFLVSSLLLTGAMIGAIVVARDQEIT
ncbi:MAG: hypothetical protein CUN53_08025, partial [Phototrophicales bacterium]